MTDPILVEVTRGALVESRHRVGVVVSEPNGRVVFSLGDAGSEIFPRSAVKAIQTLPLVESGAADEFGFGPSELALAQASHHGEPEHAALAKAMLDRAGLGERDLECGVHAPLYKLAAEALVATGEAPSQLHNNCSGKHAGFLAASRAMGVQARGYVEAAHPVQQAVREAMQSLTGAAHDPAHCAIDGCSIPTYRVPLAALALGFARFGSGVGLSAGRAAAARRIYEAASASPFHVAGTDGFCTEALRLLAGRALVKTGAEGVFCAAVPSRGFGIALKAADGSTRAAEAVMAALLARLFPDLEEPMMRWSRAPVRTRRDRIVGTVRAIPEAFVDFS
jgi:L-asparaginase II